jgi:hypothetical protein
VQFYQQTAARQISEAEGATARACRAIADRYQFYTTGSRADAAPPADAELRRQLTNVVHSALRSFPGSEGGIWQGEAGSLAYAFPTYEGAGPKTELPVAELPSIRQVNEEALSNEGSASRRLAIGQGQTLVLQSCALPGPLPQLTAWAMTRVFTGAGPAYNRMLLGMGVLGFTVIASALWLMLVILGWTRRLHLIREQLGANSLAELPRLEPTGERELDRLVVALNEAGLRLSEAQRRIGAAERLAAVGRLSAGLAHEIRNPIAAMRLKAENALADKDPAWGAAALHSILEQVGRLDALLKDLLAMTQPREPELQRVDVEAFLEKEAQAYREQAGTKAIAIDVKRVPEGLQACFDPDQMGRALDNLLLNAMQVLAPGGRVILSAQREGSELRLRVEDDGPGIAADIKDRLFDPFVTGRADGTGLGLAIVREIARAHGGEARLLATRKGSLFEIEVPWRPC